MLNFLSSLLSLKLWSCGVSKMDQFISGGSPLVHISGYIVPSKVLFSAKKYWYISDFSTEMYVVGTHNIYWGASNEFPQHMFLEKYEKYYVDTPSYLAVCD